jgi:two-component system, OmpR family, phosphate regulon sensor histidine kinase PhoR
VKFQTRLFLASVTTATLALAIAGTLFSLTMRREADARIEQTLVAEARLTATLLRDVHEAVGATTTPPDLDREADRIGELINARVTFVAADGRVLGDSSEPPEALASMENHATRPEILEAGRSGLGHARRYSDTLHIEMLYVAVPVVHPSIAFARVALPLTDIRRQLGAIVRATLGALAFALLGSAGVAYLMTRRLGRRVGAIAAEAGRYRRGDLTPSALDFGDDELGVVARAMDQTVQDLASKINDLARDRGRTTAMLAGMIEGVIVVDPQGRVQLLNEAARQMLRMDDLALGRHYVETIRHPAISDLVGAALNGRASESVQLSPPRDATRTIMARAAPSAPHGAVLVLHDITDLKRADQIRRDFVANVSHELRTPLTAIRGYVEALSEGDASQEERRHFLDIILRHALRMERMVKDLLRLARLDAGQEILEPVDCDTRALIQSVISDLTPALEGRGQHVDIAIGTGAEHLRGDPAKLHDAIRNLVANAGIYSPERTTIRIDARRESSCIVIAISDQGPGIPEDDLTRVFERFYRVDKSRARDPGGTGLGLAIVKHLVELHGGHVRAENRSSGGATFTIELAARSTPNEPHVARSTQHKERGRSASAREPEERVSTRTDRKGSGNREDPRPDDLAGNTPANGRKPPGGAHSDN